MTEDTSPSKHGPIGQVWTCRGCSEVLGRLHKLECEVGQITYPSSQGPVLEEHTGPKEGPDWTVHISHCCVKCGCKYGAWMDCPVVMKKREATGHCEECAAPVTGCVHPIDMVDQFGCHACGTTLLVRPDTRETYRGAIIAQLGSRPRLIKDLDDNDIHLTIGEGYVSAGITFEIPREGKTIKVLRNIEVTPAKAREISAKFAKYANIAESITPGKQP